jgi:hypothetical protein
MSSQQQNKPKKQTTPKKNPNKPSKSHTKNKKHQKHRNQGEKHFGITGQAPFRGSFSRFIKRADDDDNEQQQDDSLIEQQEQQYRKYSKRPLESNAYKFEEREGQDESYDNVFQDERSRSLHVMLEDFGGASAYHRKPWEKEWDQKELTPTDFSILTINPTELAQDLKSLSVQKRLNLYSPSEEVLLDPIMKVDTSNSQVVSIHDIVDSSDSEEVIVSSVPLALVWNEQQVIANNKNVTESTTVNINTTIEDSDDALSDISEELDSEDELDDLTESQEEEQPIQQINTPIRYSEAQLPQKIQQKSPVETHTSFVQKPTANQKISANNDADELALLDELMGMANSKQSNTTSSVPVKQEAPVTNTELKFERPVTTAPPQPKKNDDNLDDWLDSLI